MPPDAPVIITTLSWRLASIRRDLERKVGIGDTCRSFLFYREFPGKIQGAKSRAGVTACHGEAQSSRSACMNTARRAHELASFLAYAWGWGSRFPHDDLG